MNIDVFEISDPDKKQEACRGIIFTLLDWFGMPASNENYINKIVDKDVFSAIAGNEIVGTVALKYHFSDTAEIWWMGIKPEFHRQEIGTRLFEAALNRVKKRACKWMILETLSPKNPDEYYARTRNFYQKVVEA